MKKIFIVFVLILSACYPTNNWKVYNQSDKFTICRDKYFDKIVISNGYRVILLNHFMDGTSKIKIDNVVYYCPTTSLIK